MKGEERGRRADSTEGAPVEQKGARPARIGGDLLAAAVLAVELSGKLAAAVTRWLRTWPAQTAGRGFPHKAQQPEPPEQQGRADDRNLTLESEHKLLTRRRRGTILVACAFAVSCAGGLGFLFAYWTDASNELLGSALAAFLGGMGAGMVAWAHRLTAHKEATEPREPLDSPLEERNAAATQFAIGTHEIQRRSLLCWMSAIGLGFVATMVVSLLRSFGFNPYTALATTVWKPGQRLVTNEGKPISIDAMPPGSTVIVFPENDTGSEKSQTVLIRVNPSMLQLPADRADWAPQGYVAYSRVCTHAGCVVGLYEATAHLLLCPCHQSTFDILRAAQPTSGPAARPLPQLPLYADAEGFLRAGGGFSEYPGPGYWGMPQ